MTLVYKPWGTYEVLYANDSTWLKILTVDAGQRLSAQRHLYRQEFWLPMTPGRAIIGDETLDLAPGKVYAVATGQLHRLMNPFEKPLVVYEWAVGKPSEHDIIREEDDYGR